VFLALLTCYTVCIVWLQIHTYGLTLLINSLPATSRHLAACSNKKLSYRRETARQLRMST